MNKTKPKWLEKVSSKFKVHFDKNKPEYKVLELVKPEKVVEHRFFPFLGFEIWAFQYAKLKQLRQEGKTSYKYEELFKVRPIRYACYGDSYIFSYYNSILVDKYESFLKSNELENVPIAYRSIQKKDGRGKSNIDFAAEAFIEIKERGDCFCFGIDIKGFFDNLDPKVLKNNLKKVLNQDELEVHWYKIFKILTDYRYMQLDDLLEYLGKEKKDLFKKGARFEQICLPEELREIIKKHPHLIKKNLIEEKIDGKTIIKKGLGIPQGTNISGVLANIYMLEFDRKVNDLVKNLGGYYRRYSDDILIVLNNKEEAKSLIPKIIDILDKDLKLRLSEKKTISCSFKFRECLYEPILAEQKAFGENCFQYLGFTYDGESVRIRNSTIGNFWKDAKPHIRNIIYTACLNNTKIPYSKIIGLYSHRKNRKRENGYGNFYGYVREADKRFSEDYGFEDECKIKRQLRKSWNQLDNYIKEQEDKYSFLRTREKIEQ